MADYLDICLQSNTTPNEDAKFNVIGGLFDKMEIESVRQLLIDEYQITLDNKEIIDMMEDYGLDFGISPVGMSMHEILYSYIIGEV
jgi:hypothetical protein